MDCRIGGVWLGRRRYQPVHALQRQLHAKRRAGELGNLVLLLEHEPVITLGRGSRTEHILASPEALARCGVELVETDRGGDVTLHAPGQLIAYPIVDLNPDRRDVRRWVRSLTEVMRRLAAQWNVAAGTVEGLVGLWADAAQPNHWPGAASAQQLHKLGAVGVRISRWVTMHGFAFNLCNDLDLFSLIIPCGIRQYPVGSVEMLTGCRPTPQDAADAALAYLAEVLDAQRGPLQDRSHWELDALAQEFDRRA